MSVMYEWDLEQLKLVADCSRELLLVKGGRCTNI